MEQTDAVTDPTKSDDTAMKDDIKDAKTPEAPNTIQEEKKEADKEEEEPSESAAGLGDIVEALGVGDAAAAVEAAAKDTVNSFKDLFKSPEQKESNKIFHAMDTDGSNSASVEEIAQFVQSNQELWSLLQSSLDQSQEASTRVATQVAMELATGLQGKAALEAEITKDQFYNFRRNYIKDEAGTQEFFQRTIFASFDADQNGTLDRGELSQFLEIYYKSDSIFIKGDDLTLPPKEILEKMILERFDTSGEGSLSLETIRSIISGQMEADMKEELEAAAIKAAEEERLRKEAEKKARIEAEEKARKEAEEKARKEAEEKARKEAEEKAKKEAEEKAKREAEEKARKEAEEKARIEAEEEIAQKEAEQEAIQKKQEDDKLEAARISQKLKAQEAKLALAMAEASVQTETGVRVRTEDNESVTDSSANKPTTKKETKDDNETQTAPDACVFCDWVQSLFDSPPPPPKQAP